MPVEAAPKAPALSHFARWPTDIPGRGLAGEAGIGGCAELGPDMADIQARAERAQ
jgi:hypothetical protein